MEALQLRKWLYVEGSRKPISAKTRSWVRAQEKAEELKKSGHQSAVPGFDLKPETMREAVTKFLENKAQEAKGKRWNIMVRSDLTDFANWWSAKLVTPTNVNTLALEDYRKTWKGSPGTRSRRLVRLSHFLK